MKKLQGKAALITGGAGGIGLGMAIAFAKAGMSLALADVDSGRLAPAVDAIRALGVDAMPVTLDVTDYAAWQQAVDAVENQLGPVALLCNNAGLGGSAKLAEDEPRRWKMIVEVNLIGAFYGCRTLLPRMLARGQPAHIVNTASFSGLRSNPGMSAYDASKHGLVGMSDSLRGELGGTCVGLSVLYPGTVRTDFTGNSAALVAASTGLGQSALDREMGDMLKGGMDPCAVGDLVLEGVCDNRYHIYTHPNWKPIIEAHFRERLDAFGIEVDPAVAARILDALNQRINAGLD